MPARRIENTIHLSGVVGGLPDEGFGQDDVIRLLAETTPLAPVTIRLNSGGGDAFAGSAIHAILARDKARISVIVEGVAASAASLIAIGGNRLHIAPGALFMIHQISTVTIGDEADHERAINALRRLGEAYASTYAAKTKKSVEEMRRLMAAETWLDGAQAVSTGFADTHGKEGETAAPAPYAYAAYTHAPAKLVALARQNGWTPRMAIGANGAKPCPAPVHVAAETPEMAKRREEQAQICEAAVAAGVPGLASRLLRSHCTLAEARARIRAATDGINGPNVKSFDAAVAKLNGGK